MNFKKSIAMFLSLAMILGTMCFPALADTAVVNLGNANFNDNPGMLVFDGTNYYTSLYDAVEVANSNPDITELFCKENADLGYVNHATVCSDLTIYGNGAKVEKNETFDIGNTDTSSGTDVDITADFTFKIYNLEGCTVWGTKKTQHTINIVIEDCADMGEVWLPSEGDAGIVNLSMKNCTFLGNDGYNCNVAVYAAGTINLDNVDFSGEAQPVNLNNKSNGTQTIVLKNCDFVSCGSNSADYTVPVRVLAKNADGESILTVDNCSFTDTNVNIEGHDSDILLDYASGETKATIVNTDAKIGVETSNNDVEYALITSNDAVAMTNASSAASPLLAMIGSDYYSSLQEAIYDAAVVSSESNHVTIQLLAGEFTEPSFKIPSKISNVTIIGAPNKATVLKNVNITDSQADNGYAKNIKIDGIVFDNSYLRFNTAYANLVYSDWTITNCEFRNVEGDAAVGFNNTGVSKPLDNLTFTNNIIDGVLTTDKSGLIIQKAGNNTVIENNTFTNVNFNAIQLKNGSETASISIKNNVFVNNKNNTINLVDCVGDINVNKNVFVNTSSQYYIIHISTDIDASENFFGFGTSLEDAVFNENYESYMHYRTEAGDTTILSYYTDTELTNKVDLTLAKIGDVSYAKIDKALAAASDGSEIDVVADWNVENPIEVTKNVTIDLNGKTISAVQGLSRAAAGTVFAVDGAELTIIDSSDDKSGTIETYGNAIFEVTSDGNVAVAGGLYSHDVSAYAAEGYVGTQNEYGYYTVVADDSGNSKTVTEAVKVSFEKKAENKYDIVLEADSSASEIHRFLSAELDIQVASDSSTINLYSVEGNSAYGIEVIDPLYNDSGVWGFHLDDKAINATGNKFVIGTVTLTGYGKGELALKANANNKVEAIESIDGNIVKKYVADDDTLVLPDAATEVEIKVPTKKLTIKVSFPNAIAESEKAYQNMQVKVSGKDIEDIDLELGSDGDFALNADGQYVIEIADALTLNNSYNITLTGAGYRTAKYRVTMTDDKTVYFWNDAVKGEAIAFEEGGKVKANTSFLAGDIAEDNIIDKYDLAAVVSYFGKYGLKADAELFKYAKYDLNRDGKIDSEDIAYVLASFGY